eukprot:TRINITY_DN4099_c0_g1_i1.p1 TRINITY_DN4099_c0_g1~~TRINITY_DN4099_c0_g1_i1.p1  ORF type:complete len:177 (+),score=35.31 TRINITY_DN4099_c0_g1_i1:124-654(+)
MSEERKLKEKIIEQVEEEIKKLEEEAEKFNSPATFVEYSKRQRRINTLRRNVENQRKELAQQVRNESVVQERTEQNIRNITQEKQEIHKKYDQYLDGISYLMKLLIPLALVFIFRKAYWSFRFDGGLLFPLSSLLGTQESGFFRMSLGLAWIFICSRVVKRIRRIFSDKAKTAQQS